MAQQLALVTILVPDYDQAISYFRGVLGFELVEDTPLGSGKRWVVVRPGRSGGALLLAQAGSPDQGERIGDQAGGRVFLFLHTDDFAGDYARYVAAGVHFVERPRTEPYGTVAVFDTLSRDRWEGHRGSAAAGCLLSG